MYTILNLSQFEDSSNDVNTILSCYNHDHVSPYGMVTLTKAFLMPNANAQWQLSGDTCRNDSNGSIGETMSKINIGRLNIYNADTDTATIQLAPITGLAHGDHIELYNKGILKLKLINVNNDNVNIWSIDNHTAVKPKGAAIQRYMGEQESKQTWALIGAIES